MFMANTTSLTCTPTCARPTRAAPLLASPPHRCKRGERQLSTLFCYLRAGHGADRFGANCRRSRSAPTRAAVGPTPAFGEARVSGAVPPLAERRDRVGAARRSRPQASRRRFLEALFLALSGRPDQLDYIGVSSCRSLPRAPRLHGHGGFRAFAQPRPYPAAQCRSAGASANFPGIFLRSRGPARAGALGPSHARDDAW